MYSGNYTIDNVFAFLKQKQNLILLNFKSCKQAPERLQVTGIYNSFFEAMDMLLNFCEL